jgi:hypothetical protein
MITGDTPTCSRAPPANGMITVDTPARRAVIMPLVPAVRVGSHRPARADPAPAGQDGGMTTAPADWEADVVLNDGGTVHLRPIRPDDADRLREFHSRLSQQTVFNRYFAYRPSLSDSDVHHFTHVDHDSRVGVRRDAARRDHRRRALRPAARHRRGRGRLHRRGRPPGPRLGSGAARAPRGAARERGIARFMADVLPTNRAMLGSSAAPASA